MKKSRTLEEYWMWLGVAALGIAGLFATILVVARSPQFKELRVVQQFFEVALVVHVDLSVLIWFLSMVCMGVARLMTPHFVRWPYWHGAGFACVALATVLIALSPLGAWVPLKSNYIPVLHNPLFLASLGLLAAGLVVSLLPVVITHVQRAHWRSLDATGLGYLAAAAAVLLALAGFILGGKYLPGGMELTEHYDRLFWAGGHILQFAFTLLVMTAWVQLLQAISGAPLNRRMLFPLYALTLLGALASLGGFALADMADDRFTLFQTRIMIEWGGLGAGVMGLIILAGLFKTPWAMAQRTSIAALVVSLLLFFVGGGLGLIINGQNTGIPAHYHGMIGGITQALMGLAYLSLPRFGCRSVASSRLALWQALVYGMGQLMHAGGLAYSGGYGLLRKTAGGFGNLSPDLKIALGVFTFGGLLAIIGGILFVVVMVRAFTRRENKVTRV
ncbi:MAG: hypothetical protein ACKVOE_04790 [Rickettsiales bacterium]